MNIVFETTDIEILVLVNHLEPGKIYSTYFEPHSLSTSGIGLAQIPQPVNGKKQSKTVLRAYAAAITSSDKSSKIKYLLCADADLFLMLTGSNASKYLGYVLPALANKGLNVIYIPSHRQVFNNPQPIKDKIASAITSLISHKLGFYVEPGKGLQQRVSILSDPGQISEALDWIQSSPKGNIYCDIETFSLDFYDAGIGSIAFTYSDKTYAFLVDLSTGENSKIRRELLKKFFTSNKHNLVFHNISFDVTVLIYQLFMEDLLDHKGLHQGLNCFLREFDDTKIIAYLATNSCAGNDLSLKSLAQSFAGNWAVDDIKDIRKIGIIDLLSYNGVDTLSTEYVYKTYYPIMVKDQQEDIYKGLFKDALRDIIQMQLTGMPLNMTRVLEVKKELQKDYKEAFDKIHSSSLVQESEYLIKEKWVNEKNSKLKKKKVTIEDCGLGFNPNSDKDLQLLLYEIMSLPVLDKTDSGMPSTSGSTIKSLLNHTDKEPEKELLNALIDYKLVTKILSTYIPTFEEAPKAKNNWNYLYGNFNLGGTVSGRLSSSNPNLQNIPAGGKYGKLIKSCFQAPPGYLLIGLDFSSLEDRISALTTKDKNKLKVYLEKYDGHCLRACAYFGNQMPDIIPGSVESINSIENKYPDLRQKSKAPTFLLTYGGTHHGLVKNCGFSVEEAQQIEASYHELYKESDAWVKQKLDEASHTGYITAAFGLRVRTPRLSQVVRGNRYTPKEAEAEGRTAGNALGQSWCLLNNRAASAFLKKVRHSDLEEQIQICSMIHDAQYYIIPDDISTLMFVNKHLVEAVNWNNHPDIYHSDVGLGGELSVFFPSWAKEVVIPNNATKTQIYSIIEKEYK